MVAKTDQYFDLFRVSLISETILAWARDMPGSVVLIAAADQVDISEILRHCNVFVEAAIRDMGSE